MLLYLNVGQSGYLKETDCQRIEWQLILRDEKGVDLNSKNLRRVAEGSRGTIGNGTSADLFKITLGAVLTAWVLR